jgi:hypothetical protein
METLAGFVRATARGEGCMSGPRTVAEKELSRELNHLWHVRQLFEENGARIGRQPRAEQLGIQAHLVHRVFAPSARTYQGIPRRQTLEAIALVIGCDFNTLLRAFTKDVYPNSKEHVEAIQVAVDDMVDMSGTQRKQLVEVAKALKQMTRSQGRDLVRYAKRVIADPQ